MKNLFIYSVAILWVTCVWVGGKSLHALNEPVRPAMHTPLVTDHGDGRFSTNPKADALREDMIYMSKLAFLMRKNDPLVEKTVAAYKAMGWEISPFQGRSGLNNSIEDTPGFVAFRSSDSIMIVVFRGSDSSVVAPGKKVAADWEVNFDAKIIDTPHGKMHRGFYNKVVASHQSLMDVIKQYITPLPVAMKNSLQIFFTGHSQGGALAPIAATKVVEEIKKSGLLGPNFDNTKTNTVQVHVFSAPRAVGDQKGLDTIHDTLGKHNIIRQNVTGILANDPVPVATPGKTATALLKLVPFGGQALAARFGGGSTEDAGGRSVGYLAADKVEHVANRVKSIESESVVKKNLNDLKELAQAIKDNPKDVATNIKNIGKTGVGIVRRSVVAVLAPLHYGGVSHESTLENGTPYTSVHTMTTSPETSTLLQQGYEHKQDKSSGLGGKIRRGIENLANKKVAIENKVVGGFKNAAQKIKQGFLSLGKKNKTA